MTEIPEREFTLADFDRLTPDLSPAERLATFLGLPVEMRDQAWRELGQRIESQSRARWAEERLGPCTAQELADEIAAIWGECRMVPLGYVGPHIPDQPRARRDYDRGDMGGDLDCLRSIPSAEFVERLSGREVSGAGFALCPFHDERTPSLHVSRDDGCWHCFGCQAGGGILEFYARLHDRAVPSGGVEFVEFVREVAAAVVGMPG
jgi:hypothetical protein